MTFIVPENKRLVHIGQRFGMLEVVGVPFLVEGKNQRCQAAVCRCDCGKFNIVRTMALRHQGVSSCGCVTKERQRNAIRTHGETKTVLYKRWIGMKDRCGTSASSQWIHYGARGIVVCDEWIHDFEAFRGWSLKNGFDKKLEIDRIDNDGPYAPWNCRWVTATINKRNRRNTVFVTAFGVTKTAAEWICDDRCNAKRYLIILGRLRHGWSPEEAITRQPRQLRPRKAKNARSISCNDD